MLNNFRPFRPTDFQKHIEEARALTGSLNPAHEDFSSSLRGYGEIFERYRMTCFDGRRGPGVRLCFNPRDVHDNKTLNGLIREFKMEIASMASRHGIDRDGYSVCVSHRAVLRHNRRKEYFALIEIVDGAMRPTIIGPACVESFSRAPVAFFVRYLPEVGEYAMWPICAGLSARESISKLVTLPLSELKRSPTPSYAFALMCGAIQQAVADPPPESADSEWEIHEEFESAPGSGEGMVAQMPVNIELGAASIRSVCLEGSILMQKVRVECDFDGVIKDFCVQFDRSSVTGRMSAQAWRS